MTKEIPLIPLDAILKSLRERDPEARGSGNTVVTRLSSKEVREHFEAQGVDWGNQGIVVCSRKPLLCGDPHNKYNLSLSLTRALALDDDTC